MSTVPTFNLIELYEQFPKEITRKEARQECKKRGWYLVDDKYGMLDAGQAFCVGLAAIGLIAGLMLVGTNALGAACIGEKFDMFVFWVSIPVPSVPLVVGGILFPVITHFKSKRNREKIDEEMAQSIRVSPETFIELHKLGKGKSHP